MHSVFSKGDTDVEWLNYHHLLYFWTVARLGTISKAAKELSLAQPTISGQIRQLEETLDVKLFERAGRGLKLTEMGQMVFRYADEIFTLGGELMDTLKGRPGGKPLRLLVGVSDMVPKLISHRLIAPALHMDDPVQITCIENKTDRLLAELAVHGLDLVIADAPIAGEAKVRAYNHFLGETGTTFLAVPDLARKYRKGFPQSLDGAPVLLPAEGTIVRRALDHWFEDLQIRPYVVANFDDTALLKAFGEAGEGIFPAPGAIENPIAKQYGVQVVGRTDAVVERFYAITVERRIKHPAVVRISKYARERLFAE
jgi:LysR family transcriptional activator of nhaA